VAPLLGAAIPGTTVPRTFVCTEMHEPREEDGAEVTSAFTACLCMNACVYKLLGCSCHGTEFSYLEIKGEERTDEYI